MLRENSHPISVKTVAVIPAAGSGMRMGDDQAKQFMDLDGKPLLAVTLQSFQDCSAVNAIVLVVPAENVESCKKEIVARYKFDKVKRVVPGGKRRQDSVRLGLEATGGDYELVLIHDGVRPIIETELIERVIESTRSHRAVITGLPSKETIKEISDVGRVIKTYDRRCVWLIQTPQAFYYDDISAAHQKAFAEGWEEATDDCALIEKAGIPVKVIEGSEKNIKITTPHDLELARFFLSGGRPEISDSRESRG